MTPVYVGEKLVGRVNRALRSGERYHEIPIWNDSDLEFGVAPNLSTPMASPVTRLQLEVDSMKRMYPRVRIDSDPESFVLKGQDIGAAAATELQRLCADFDAVTIHVRHDVDAIVVTWPILRMTLDEYELVFDEEWFEPV